MATIGEQLLQPESGWKRYDDSDNNISYVGDGWERENNSHYSKIVGDKICFNLVGSKIRILVFTNNSHSKDVKIKINNIVYSYVEYINPITPASLVLVFEKEMPSFREYSVEIYIERKTDSQYGWFGLDSIDIDESGILKPYNPNFYKYLLYQDNQYYTIKSDFYKNGNYESIPELEEKEILTQNDFETYGVNDLNLLTKTIDTQVINSIDKGNLGNGKLFEIPFGNDFMSISEVK
ncbi:TPA: cell adhesion protein [Clostridium botulinum]